MLKFLHNRTKKSWRIAYREELAQELESLKQRLVEYKYWVKIIEGKIAAAEAIQQSDILDDQNLRGKPRDEPRGSSEQAVQAFDATSVASGQ